MKVFIIGPVISTKYYGGVAQFVESLAKGFNNNGSYVEIVTDYSEKTSIEGVKIKSFSYKKKVSFRTMYKIKKYVLREKPDMIITSLSYGYLLGGKKLKRKGIKRIHFVHGFPSFTNYGILKTLLMNHFDKKYQKNFDSIIANSEFTRVVNTDILGFSIDKVVKLGLGTDFFEFDTETNNYEKKDILYVGRLVKAKNIDKIMTAMYKRNSKEVLHIVGSGPEKNNLMKMADNYSLNVVFHGKLNSTEVIELYKKAKVFISLNTHEPFGMTFLEALYYGCSIIAPSIGGQVDFLHDFIEDVKFVDIYDYSEIGRAIDSSIKKKTANHKQLIKEYYNYDRVASDIEKIYKEV